VTRKRNLLTAKQLAATLVPFWDTVFSFLISVPAGALPAAQVAAPRTYDNLRAVTDLGAR
jgi:hypothetical protein